MDKQGLYGEYLQLLIRIFGLKWGIIVDYIIMIFIIYDNKEKEGFA